MNRSKTNSVPKLTAEQTAAKLVLLGVTRSKDFEYLCSGKGKFEGMTRPANIPRSPMRFYKDEFTNWPDFLDKGVAYNKAEGFIPEVPTLQELTDLVHAKGIDTKNKLYAALDKRELGEMAPLNPETYYRCEGFKWESFLAPGKGQFVGFEEARELLKGSSMKSIRDWRAFCRKGKRPRVIPSIPSKYYESEWVSWPHFFSNDTD